MSCFCCPFSVSLSGRPTVLPATFQRRAVFLKKEKEFVKWKTSRKLGIFEKLGAVTVLFPFERNIPGAPWRKRCPQPVMSRDLQLFAADVFYQTCTFCCINNKFNVCQWCENLFLLFSFGFGLVDLLYRSEVWTLMWFVSRSRSKCFADFLMNCFIMSASLFMFDFPGFTLSAGMLYEGFEAHKAHRHCGIARSPVVSFFE